MAHFAESDAPVARQSGATSDNFPQLATGTSVAHPAGMTLRGTLVSALIGITAYGTTACHSEGEQRTPSESTPVAGAGGASVSGTSKSTASTTTSTTTGGSSSKTGAGGAAQTSTTGDTPVAGAAGAAAHGDDWFKENTVSKRGTLSVPGSSEALTAQRLMTQLVTYDPGSEIRCAVADDPTYRATIDTIGGVTWGYQVTVLEDESKPRLQAGFPKPQRNWAAEAGDAKSSAVEIEEADIVGLSETSALFFSSEHGLLLVDLSAAQPTFTCGVKLPGRVNKFFYYQGHLVVMTENQQYGASRQSYLLHFSVAPNEIRFVESIDLGRGSTLDTRRFNDRLVVYSEFATDEGSDSTTTAGAERYYQPSLKHRALRVFGFGERLTEQLNQTLLDTTPNQSYLTSGSIPEDTAVGTKVSESSSFGRTIWASDHYFVVTEALTKTYLSSWQTQNYSYCSKSHSVERSYRHCDTIYETRPNPNYTPPDNSGGDRACQGVTLADCLRSVSRASNPTIQVPVGQKCEQRTYNDWICDETKYGSYTYPLFRNEDATRLTIYEYTDQGFIRLDSKVSEITTPGLDQTTLDAKVPTLTTSSETYDLAIPGALQTLYFQNGFLYAIAAGKLQVYSMAENSLVRTSTLSVVNATLQTSLFTDDKLYLSDFGYSGSYDKSVLRVIDLTNPAFPRQSSEDRTLPGGHRSILPTSKGILTIGTVNNFAPDIHSVLKLGLFTDPFTSELAYLILGTDLSNSYLGDAKSQYFDASAERLFLPYTGQENASQKAISRVGVSHLEDSTIVSDGAVAMPESVARVRPRPASSGTEMLAFSSSAVEWLRPADKGWAATPVLEYYRPIALYRLTDQDEYLEVLRLGNRCQLHFASAAKLNVRTGAAAGAAFDCVGYSVWAYDRNLVFSATSGVRFAADGSFTQLTEAEITDLTARRAERPICLLSQQSLDNISVDFQAKPDLSAMVCYSPKEYQEALTKINSGSTGASPTGG